MIINLDGPVEVGENAQILFNTECIGVYLSTLQMTDPIVGPFGEFLIRVSRLKQHHLKAEMQKSLSIQPA
jgi:hypothetical protein